MSINRIAVLTLLLLLPVNLQAADPMLPPQLPGGVSQIQLSGAKLLRRAESLLPDVQMATTPPVVDVMYYPGQDYEGHPWSVWGDGLAVGDKYYSSIGDHLAPQGNAYVYEYDASQKTLRRLLDLKSVLQQPEGHYSPGKIHSRLDLGKDGCLYFSTHRGSTRVTTDEYHYKGDWILKHHLDSGKTEIVAYAPLSKQCLPTGLLDPDRLMFYAGTADGDHKNKRVMFLAYDTDKKKLVYSDEQGPYRAAILARSTGKVYFQQSGGRNQELPLVCFDPAKPGPPQPVNASVGLRACTQESSQGLVYTIDGDQLWAFDTKTETAKPLGPAIVGSEDYTASLDLDPATERYLYYIPGAHGGSYRDESPLVQYDLKTNTRKVLCCLQPVCHQETGFLPMGTYGLAVSPDGSTVYVTWNGNHGTSPDELDGKKPKFNICGLTVIHVPESERQP